jgi:hypothetical protein
MAGWPGPGEAARHRDTPDETPESSAVMPHGHMLSLSISLSLSHTHTHTHTH